MKDRKADNSQPEIVTPAKTGRPCELTTDLAEKIFECLRLGLSYQQTADAAGISIATFRRWRKRHPFFRKGIKRAEAEAVCLRLDAIRNAAAKSWQAAAWWLERRHPDQWAKVESLRIEAKRAFNEAELQAIGEATRAHSLSAAEKEKRWREIFGISRIDAVRRQLFGVLPGDADADTLLAAERLLLEREKFAESLRSKTDAGLEEIEREIAGNPKALEAVKSLRAALIPPDLPAEPTPAQSATPYTRAEKIRAVMRLNAQAREIAGKPALPEAQAFELAARELDTLADPPRSGDTPAT